jgi:hypothetical protein
MGLKEDLENAGDHLKDAGKNIVNAGGKLGEKIKDGVSEATHRAAASGEHAKRDALGDHLTPAEKAQSFGEEAKHTIQADVDAAKRKT